MAFEGTMFEVGLRDSQKENHRLLGPPILTHGNIHIYIYTYMCVYVSRNVLIKLYHWIPQLKFNAANLVACLSTGALLAWLRPFPAEDGAPLAPMWPSKFQGEPCPSCGRLQGLGVKRRGIPVASSHRFEPWLKPLVVSIHRETIRN